MSHSQSPHQNPKELNGYIVDVTARRVFPGVVTFEDGKILSVTETSRVSKEQFILPGFIDAHVHIESSMLVPSEFARLAVTHGTIATVSDPHEIANVMGTAGINFMIENGKQVPFHFNFGAPSCVPATAFETAGAAIDADAIEALLQRDEIRYLSEMMNYPGVIHRDAEVNKKIAAAIRHHKPVDGHAPGLQGEDAIRYITNNSSSVVISTDHECYSTEEALFKLKHGMKVLIREGSAAKNFEALIPLLDQFPESIMFCSDDKHPDDLERGHINELVKRALSHGCNLWNVLRAATLNPVLHYGLQSGLLRVADSADFIVTDDLEQLNVLQTYVRGQLVAEEGKSMISRVKVPALNNFNCSNKSMADFGIRQQGTQLKVIEALDGQLITRTFLHKLEMGNMGQNVESDTTNDVLKFAVVNRYRDAPVAIGFIKNFGLKRGAIASSVGHDSHNILAVGTNDAMLCHAVNAVIDHHGGLSAISDDDEKILPLPVAGIMSDDDAYEIARQYAAISGWVKERLGSTLHASFMTLSFMALLVIPQLKLSDKGLFDGARFQFTSLFND